MSGHVEIDTLGIVTILIVAVGAIAFLIGVYRGELHPFTDSSDAGVSAAHAEAGGP